MENSDNEKLYYFYFNINYLYYEPYEYYTRWVLTFSNKDFTKLFKIQDSVMSNQTKKQSKDKPTRIRFLSPSASIYNSDSTIIINSKPKKKFKKDNESISKLTEVVIISFYMYLWFVIFIGIHKIG